MELTKLFEIQRKLDAEIEKKHPTMPGEDRLAKRILALQVELGECANEWRGFKFWSTDQEPRRSVYKAHYEKDAHGPIMRGHDPLLEEYVDCLHFVLSIGNHIQGASKQDFSKPARCESSIESQFMCVMKEATSLYGLITFWADQALVSYKLLLMDLVNLGFMLGFTWEQVEKAYMEKNQINHERQAEGY